MPAIVRHAIVLLIADDRDGVLETASALAAMGCIAHRVTPGSRLDHARRYEAAVLLSRPHTPWCIDALATLRSTSLACASLVLLEAGGAAAVAEVLGSGAVDCLIGPVSEPELTESIGTVIESTRRWRYRLLAASRDQVAADDRGLAAARVFEPAGVRADDIEIKDVKVEELVRRVSEQSGLTRREREVLYWLLVGHRYVDIAAVLGVAPRTAKFHAANLLDKLELDSRYDLSRLLAEDL